MNNRTTKLTVNVITYNHEKYIQECLDSILMQKTDFDYIIRVFDDASTDTTQDILKQYKEKYPDKFELFLAEKNLSADKDGTFFNTIRAYKDINTPYYIYIEGDDYYYYENAFQKLADILDKNPDCSCACGKIKMLYELNKKFICTFPDTPKNIFTIDDAKNTDIYFHVQHSGKMVRTSAINIDKEHPIYYVFDITQMYELIKKGNIYISDDIVSVYRYTPQGSYTSSPFSKKIKWLFNVVSGYNDYTNQIFEKNIMSNLVSELSTIYNQYYKKNTFLVFEQEVQYTTPKEDVLLKIKEIKHYLIPRFILDILNIPRDIFRLGRNLYKRWKK